MKNNNQNTKGLIPKHWQLKKLGEVCTYSKGKKPAILKETITKECTVPYINIKAFEKGIISEYTDGVKCTICNDDDLLMVWDGARCGLIGKAKKGAVGSTLMKIIPNENIHKEYLYHFISSKFWTLNTKPKGVGIPHIEPTLLWNFEFVLPPLPEQIAIVAKIEELLSELENGKKQLQTAKKQLKVYRQSLLKAAFEGKFTNENINEGIKELKNEKIKNGELPKSDALSLPKGWKKVKIKDITTVNPKIPERESISKQMEVQFLPMKLVEEIINKIHLTEIRKYEDVLKGSYTPFINGDVIFAKVTPCMENGKIAIVDNLKNGIGFGSSEFHVIRSGSNVNNKFIFYYLVQDRFRHEAASEMTGAVGLRRVPKQFIENYFISLPPIQEQQLIVSELESKLTVCDKIEETISQSLQQAEALRQSILKKAFEGGLIKE